MKVRGTIDQRLKALLNENPDVMNGFEVGEDGLWIYLTEDWLSSNDTHQVHEDTWSDLIKAFHGIRRVKDGKTYLQYITQTI